MPADNLLYAGTQRMQVAADSEEDSPGTGSQGQQAMGMLRPGSDSEITPAEAINATAQHLSSAEEPSAAAPPTYRRRVGSHVAAAALHPANGSGQQDAADTAGMPTSSPAHTNMIYPFIRHLTLLTARSQQRATKAPEASAIAAMCVHSAWVNVA